MNSNPTSLPFMCALPALLVPGLALAANTNLTFKAELTAKETFDSNVYIQDEQPAAANAAAANAAGLDVVQPKQESFVTALTPRAGLDYRPCPAFTASVAYAPDVVFYEGAPDENYVAHRGLINLGGKVGSATWDLANTLIYTDGGDQGPVFARPSEIPAVGGIPLRDRREAFVFRNGFKLTQPFGKWFLRPVAAAYVHDFKTDQRLNTDKRFIYENYLDRQDINGGLDVGFRVAEKTHVILGYRYGQQDQFVGPNAANSAFTDSPYDSAYHRFLVGVEGTPAPWLKLAALAGPDVRIWADGTPANFDRNELLYFIDAVATFLPTKKDAVSITWRRYEQPAFSSQSVYEDITYDLVWKHKFDARFATSAGFRTYLGNWQAPAKREDWIYTPSASVTYNICKNLTAELAYSYDWVDSPISNTDGREFTRHLGSLLVRWTY